MFLDICSPGLIEPEVDVLLLPEADVADVAQALKLFYTKFEPEQMKRHLDVQEMTQNERKIKRFVKEDSNNFQEMPEQKMNIYKEEEKLVYEDPYDDDWDVKEESLSADDKGDPENGLKYNCTTCNLFIGENNFYSKNLNHMSQAHGIPINCKKCNEIFPFYHKLLRHNKKVHKLEDSFKFSCWKCNAKYKVKHAYDQHLLDCGIKTFPCDICGKNLINQKGLTSHKRVIHSSEYGKLACNVCGKLCATKVSLGDHVKAVHEGAFKCSCHICGKVLHNKAVLKKHIKAIHENIRNHKCDHCDYKSISNQGLQKHVDSYHLGIKHECEDCNQLFSNKYALETHKKNVHSNGQPAHDCIECGNKYKSKSGLQIHIFNSHSNQIFQCELCQKILKTKESLDYHMKSHNTEEQFSCNSCDKKFVTRTKLKMHINTHTGELPYKCPNLTCRKAYASNDQLWHHRKNCKSD
eukprot:GFUD01009075.1.p1 GENE.GFUD01009075.1~~GFUD01009075.1.p1  ORF type:complete len:523 (+),score=91.26 GFUD01009075.1:175-1569(+)